MKMRHGYIQSARRGDRWCLIRYDAVMELLALARRRGLCVGAGDCRLLLHLAPDTSLHALRLVNKHSVKGAGALTEPRYCAVAITGL
jgi:hypothetical protein